LCLVQAPGFAKIGTVGSGSYDDASAFLAGGAYLSCIPYLSCLSVCCLLPWSPLLSGWRCVPLTPLLTLTRTAGMQLLVRSSTPDYKGFKVAWGAPGVPKMSRYGSPTFKAPFMVEFEFLWCYHYKLCWWICVVVMLARSLLCCQCAVWNCHCLYDAATVLCGVVSRYCAVLVLMYSFFR
jgi:hypothetical protein